MALLALVAGQDVEPGDRPGTWRIAQRTARDRVISVVDPESRHAHKTAHSYRDGYKAHVAVEPETGLVTHCDLTSGTVADAAAGAVLIDDDRGARVILGDSAYGAGELRDHLDDKNKTAVIKPPPLRAAVDGGFSLDDFDIDTEKRTVTCPAGVTVALVRRKANFGGNCKTCPLKNRCTTATKGRMITLHPNHDLLAAARTQARTDSFDQQYRRWRPMVERSIAWLTRGTNRRLRYRGVARNRLWWAHRCAAINLQRLMKLGLTPKSQGGWAIA